MHKAYEIVSSFSPNFIESIAAYGTQIFIGTQHGHLFMYSMQSEGKRKPYTSLKIYHQTPDKKPICQMKAVPEAKLLFVLSNSMIYVYNIASRFELIHRCDETKGCNIFAMEKKTAKSPSGHTAIQITLCVCIKKSLNFFFWKSKRLEHLAKEISLKGVPKGLSWIDNLICVGFKNEYAIYNIFSLIPLKHDSIVKYSSSNMDPSISVFKKSLFGLTKENYLIFIDPKNFEKKKENIPQPIEWSSTVLDLVWDEPYAIALITNGIEIRVLERCGPKNCTLIQTLPKLDDVKFLDQSQDGHVFAASTAKVWYIRMVDISEQREKLLPQNLKLAIELTNKSDQRETFKEEICIQFAKELFAKKNFSAAMMEFINADANPYEVILLFPDSIKGELNIAQSAETVKTLPPLEGKDLEDAILELIDFLCDARQKEIRKLKSVSGFSRSSLLSFIDTTLLKCYLQTNDSFIAPLLRLKQCNFLESQKTLKRHQKISDLITLYQVNGKHEMALNLLEEQASVKNSNLYGCEGTVKYLQDLGSEHKNLIFKFSEWVLKVNPEHGLTIFTNFDSEFQKNYIPRNDVINFLSRTNESLVVTYLEYIVNICKDPTPMFCNELIINYISRIEQSKKEIQLMDAYRSKLKKILKECDTYSPETILNIFPCDSLLEERVLILHKMKEHSKVFDIYINILDNKQKALEYCEKVYVQNNEIFEIFLKTLVLSIESPSFNGVKLHSYLEVIIHILNNYASKINAGRIFPILPGDIPVHRLRDYMEKVIRMNKEKKHHNAILKVFLETEVLRLREQMISQQNKHVKITDFSLCKECKKRFTKEQVFARYPNGDIVHLSCINKCN